MAISKIQAESINRNDLTGSVLQVVQGSKTDTFTSNSTSTFVDIGLSVAITPSSSSSKVLIVYKFVQVLLQEVMLVHLS